MAIEQFSQSMYRASFRYKEAIQAEDRLREQFRQLIGAASVEDIAILKNTSEGLSVVAHGIDWRPGDNVVITDQEFPSNRIVWHSLESQGVEMREAAISRAGLNEDASPEAIIERSCDQHTRLVAVSSVQYATGLRMDLECLSAFCRRKDILFCVDAIQSLGVLPLDVQAIGIDFLAADGHKWMLGPEGVAVFYCRPELRERLLLRQYGWHMVEDHLNFDNRDWAVAESARRFECGSQNTMGILALNASLSLLLEIGMEEVTRGVLQNTSYLLEAIRQNQRLAPLSPPLVLENPTRRSGIVTFHAPGTDSRKLTNKLVASGVRCSPRGGGIRFSPHFYTPEEQLESAMQQVDKFLDS